VTLVGVVVVAALLGACIGSVAQQCTLKGRTRAAKGERYCTKHAIVQRLPGGPDRLVWVFGPHRTPGNACDGPEHWRKAWRW
jgi:hypothetical protein